MKNKILLINLLCTSLVLASDSDNDGSDLSESESSSLSVCGTKRSRSVNSEKKLMSHKDFNRFKDALDCRKPPIVKKIIQEFNDANMDWESEDEYGFTPLIIVIGRCNKPEIRELAVSMLIEAGVQLEHKCTALTSNNMMTPLCAALFKGYDDSVKRLLMAGAKEPDQSTTKLTSYQYDVLQRVQMEIAKEIKKANDVLAIFNAVLHAQNQRVHPMVEEITGQLLIARPKLPPVSPQNLD